ncbi:MAG: tetratricopeptide repeat protein [Planctomycetes bacterium]|nr:tetratricopeptide repeat protein [Planctomycetota bacterium]
MASAVSTALLITVPAFAGGGFTKAKLGEPFPEFAAKDARGAEISPQRYRDAIFVIAFVRPGQELSLRVLRDLQRIYPDLKAAGAEVVAIASERGGEKWPAIIKEHGLTFPLVADNGEKIAGLTGLVAYPTTAILSRDSILASSFLLHDYDFQKVMVDEVRGLYQKKGGKLSEEEVAKRRLEETFAEARREEERRNYRRALELYTELEKIDPEPYRISLARGEILLRLGEAAAAVEPFEKARQIHPQAARVLRGLGLAYARSGRDRDAEPLLKEAAELDPDPGPAHRELSRIYQAAGNLDQALEHAKKALAAAERRRP